jgi:hypothetical protein
MKMTLQSLIDQLESIKAKKIASLIGEDTIPGLDEPATTEELAKYAKIAENMPLEPFGVYSYGECVGIFGGFKLSIYNELEVLTY